MSQKPHYSEYHPRWYRTRVSTYWWLKRGAYLLFILRELSSVFIAWFILFTLLQIRAISHGKAAYDNFLIFAQHPVVLVLNVVSLCFILYHAVTWFNLAPKAMVIKRNGKRVPDHLLLAGNYGAWVLFSLILAWIILGG